MWRSLAVMGRSNDSPTLSKSDSVFETRLALSAEVQGADDPVQLNSKVFT
jgi:hypothetical protein